MLRAMKLLVAVVLLAAACGSKPPITSVPTGDAVVALPDVPFEALDHEQQIAFMKQNVVPVMKPLFMAHDPTEFAEFGCQTCHGPEALQGHFSMPNTKLPKLNFKDMSKFKQADVDWMTNEIAPAMAKALNLPLASEQNPSGFGCLACHTQEPAATP
jgi:hypothetical protein